MKVNCIGTTNSKSDLIKYVNDIIIKPTQLFMKQEKRHLTNENNELRKNNEDLSYRIEQLFLEFDLANPNNKSQEHYSKSLDHTDKSYNYKTTLKVNSKKRRNKEMHSTISESEIPDSSLEVVNNKLSNDSDKELSLKNQQINLLETEKQQLELQVKNIKTENQLLQNHCETITKSLNGNLEQENHKERKQSSRTESPIYIDIFDNSDQAKLFLNHQKSTKIENKYEDMVDNEVINEAQHNDNSSPIYSEIKICKPKQFPITEHKTTNNKAFTLPKHNSSISTQNIDVNLSQEIEKRFSKLSSEFNDKITELQSNLTNSLIIPHLELHKTENAKSIENFSESQKIIIDLLSKNSDILDTLHESDNNLKRDLNISLKSSDIKSASLNNHYDQENFKSSNSENQNPQSYESNETLLDKIIEQNLKIDNLADTLSLVLSNTDNIQKKSDESPIKNKLNNEHVNCSSIIKDKQNLDIFSNSLELDQEQSILSQEPNNKIMSSNLTQELFSVESPIYMVHNQSLLESEMTKLSSPLTDMKPEIAAKEYIIVGSNTPISPYNKFPEIKQSSKIPIRVSNVKIKKNNISADTYEKTFSNDLESSYETLYDPIISLKSQTEDTDISYV